MNAYILNFFVFFAIACLSSCGHIKPLKAYEGADLPNEKLSLVRFETRSGWMVDDSVDDTKPFPYERSEI